MSHLTFPLDPSDGDTYVDSTGGVTYTWDGNTDKWVINSEAQSDFGSLNDVTLSGEASGDVAVLDAAGIWRNRAISGDATLNASGTLTISDNRIGARELDVTGVGTAGWAIVADGSGGVDWGNIARSLDDVDDVTITMQSHGPSDIDGLTISGSVATFEVAAHGFSVGDPITLSGFAAGSPSEITAGIASALNGDHNVATVSHANSFTIALGSSPGDISTSVNPTAGTIETDMRGHILYATMSGGVADWRNTGNWGDLEITASGVVSVKRNVITATNLKGITGNGASGDTILSDGSGGFEWDKPAYDLDDLDDVAAGSPTNDDILVFDSTSPARWRNRAVSGDVSFSSGSMTLEDNTVELSNLDISGTAATGSIVLSDGSGSLKWAPELTLDDLGDLSVSSAESGHILVYKDSASGFINVGASGDVSISASGATSINDNVIDAANLQGASAALGNGSDGQLLAATGTNSRFKWANNTVADVDFGGATAPDGGDALLYDSENSRWKSVPLSGDVTVDASGIVSIASGAVTMQSLSGITSNGTANTSFVVSDGSGGFSLADSVATGNLNSLSDVNISGTASGGQILMRGASAWGNVALTGDATMDAAGQVTIASNRVGIAELRIAGSGDKGDFLASDGSGGLKWLANSIGELGDLTDVKEDGVAAGHVLVRGTDEKWSNASLSGDVTVEVSGGTLEVTLGNDSVEAAHISAAGTASAGAVLYSTGSGSLAWKQPRVWENDDFTGTSGVFDYGPIEVTANSGKEIGGAKKIHVNMSGVKPTAASNLIIQLGSDSGSTRAVSSSANTYSGHVRVGTGTGASMTSFSSGFTIPFLSSAAGISTFTGVAELNLMSTDADGDETWQYTVDGFSVDSSSTPVVTPHYGTGTKTVASGLQNIKVSSVSGSIQAGSISILYG